jgi:hypothetical protein
MSPIKTDFDIHFDEGEYLRFHGENFARLLASPARKAAFQEALTGIKESMQPAAVWDSWPVKEFLHEKVGLVNGVRLGGGPVVEVVRGAEELIVAVCTLGPETDQRIADYQKNREIFKALVLDELASWALDMIRQQLCQELEAGLAQEGKRASAPLSPGESTWSINDQRLLFELVDAAAIGVSLSPSMVMRPLKSLSLILGSGKNPLGVEGATNCDFCTMKERCAYRRRRPAS